MFINKNKNPKNNAIITNEVDSSAAVRDAHIDLIKELGIDRLNEEQKQELIFQIGEVIQQRVLIRIAEELTDAKFEEMTNLLETQATQPIEVQNWLTGNVPNFETVVLEEIGRYKREMVDFMQGLLNNLDQTPIITPPTAQMAAA